MGLVLNQIIFLFIKMLNNLVFISDSESELAVKCITNVIGNISDAEKSESEVPNLEDSEEILMSQESEHKEDKEEQDKKEFE